MKNVIVLLSTYNGEKYLKSQVESILNQKNVNVKLLIRDDGSSDNTVAIIDKYAKENYNIEIICGENIGYKRSFMELVYKAPISDYYAFADQDDVWLENKLIVAIEKMEKLTEPALYYSMMTQVDENLEIMNEQQKPTYPPNKEMALFQNFVQGSTIVFNKSASDLFRKYKLKNEIAHDIWLPLICSYLGKIIYDENSYILYRKHSQAVTVQMKNNYWKKLFLEVFSKKILPNKAIDVLAGYSEDLNEQDRIFLQKVSEYNCDMFTKLSILRSKNLRKFTVKGTILLKLAFLFNRVESNK